MFDVRSHHLYQLPSILISSVIYKHFLFVFFRVTPRLNSVRSFALRFTQQYYTTNYLCNRRRPRVPRHWSLHTLWKTIGKLMALFVYWFPAFGWKRTLLLFSLSFALGANLHIDQIRFPVRRRGWLKKKKKQFFFLPPTERNRINQRERVENKDRKSSSRTARCWLFERVASIYIYIYTCCIGYTSRTTGSPPHSPTDRKSSQVRSSGSQSRPGSERDGRETSGRDGGCRLLSCSSACSTTHSNPSPCSYSTISTYVLLALS